MSNNSTPAFAPRKQAAPILRNLSILLYGIPKTGKTTEAAKFPGAVLLNCEPAGTDLLKGDHDIFDVASLDHLERTTAAICASKYQTIVLDGFTWLISQAAREIVAKKGPAHRLPAYGEVTDRTQRVLGDILRSGKIVVATGHARQVEVEGEAAGKLEIRPDINPRLSDGLFGLFSIIAYCYPTSAGSTILTKPTDDDKRRIIAGDRSGILPKTMELSAAKILETLNRTQPPPPASESTGQAGKPQPEPSTKAPASNGTPNGKPLATAEQIAEFEEGGNELYGAEWEVKRRQLCEFQSTVGAATPDKLTPKEIGVLIDGFKERLAVKPKAAQPAPEAAGEPATQPALV